MLGIEHEIAKGKPDLQAAVMPRKQPSQRRARERVRHILEATQELLANNAYSAVNTNQIARKANIPVASIYQYFPNKQAIFYALAQRNLAQLEALYIELPEQGYDWECGIKWLISAAVDECIKHPGIPRLLHLLNDLPELVDLKQKHDLFCAAMLHNFMTGCGLKEYGHDLDLISGLLVDGIQALGLRVVKIEPEVARQTGVYFAKMATGLFHKASSGDIAPAVAELPISN